MVRSWRLNNGAPTRRGGRSITFESTSSDSNTIEQAGSMTSCRKENQRPARYEHGDERHPEHGDVDGEDVGQCLVEVVEDAASLADPAGDGAEIVVGDDEVSGLTSDVGATSAHGDPDVGGPQGG